MTGFSKSGLLAGALAVFAFGLPPAHAQQAAPDPSADGRPADEARRVDHDTVKKAGEDDIAKELENPIGNLTILPFENYTNFQVGPNKGTQNILEFEPVVPIHLNADWNLINRAIIPVVWNPDLSPFPSVPQAIRAYRLFRVPLAQKPGQRLDRGRGSDRPAPDRHQPDRRLQRLGPRPDRGRRPYLRAHRRRRAGQPGLVARRRRVRPGRQALCAVPRGAVRQLQFRPRLVRQLRADHHRRRDPAGRKWTVPVGAVAGRIIKLGGKLPVKLSFGGYYNVVTPQYGARWQIQSVVAVIF